MYTSMHVRIACSTSCTRRASERERREIAERQEKFDRARPDMSPISGIFRLFCGIVVPMVFAGHAMGGDASAIDVVSMNQKSRWCKHSFDESAWRSTGDWAKVAIVVHLTCMNDIKSLCTRVVIWRICLQGRVLDTRSHAKTVEWLAHATQVQSPRPNVRTYLVSTLEKGASGAVKKSPKNRIYCTRTNRQALTSFFETTASGYPKRDSRRDWVTITVAFSPRLEIAHPALRRGWTKCMISSEQFLAEPLVWESDAMCARSACSCRILMLILCLFSRLGGMYLQAEEDKLAAAKTSRCSSSDESASGLAPVKQKKSQHQVAKWDTGCTIMAFSYFKTAWYSGAMTTFLAWTWSLLCPKHGWKEAFNLLAASLVQILCFAKTKVTRCGDEQGLISGEPTQRPRSKCIQRTVCLESLSLRRRSVTHEACILPGFDRGIRRT